MDDWEGAYCDLRLSRAYGLAIVVTEGMSRWGLGTVSDDRIWWDLAEHYRKS